MVWGLLTAAEQAELLANFPLNPPATVPSATTLGDAVDPRFEKWLDQSYILRHVNDNIGDDPF